ncbi:MAG: hypothetical protein ACI9FN_003664 [Saprospiraceae bacterium]
MSTSLFSDGNGDYLGLAGGVDDFGGDPVPAGLKAYTGFIGGFLTGMDLDGEGATLPITIDWTSLDITGLNTLLFSAEFAEFFDTPGDIDASDFILLEYQIDAGGYQNLLAFEGADFTNGSTSGFFREDTNFDGEGDGALLTVAALLFTKTIPGMGLTLDLRLTISLNSGDEDFAIDSFLITGSTIPDTTPPLITCPADILMDNDAGVCEAIITFANATATDDTDPNPVVIQTMGPLSGDSFPEGETIIEFTAADASGNMSTCTFTITVLDAEDPIVTCPADQMVMADQTETYTVPDYIGSGLATATDNCTAMPAIIQSPSPGSIVGPGMTSVSIIATDDTGNQVFCTFNLTVEPVILGIDDFSLNQVTIYPNPACDEVQANTTVESITVYNMLGQVVFKTRENTFSVDGLETGLYLVIVSTENGRATRKLVVE